MAMVCVTDSVKLLLTPDLTGMLGELASTKYLLACWTMKASIESFYA
jgi:hypothetical protein